MEKPEWFKQVDASQSAPEMIAPLFAAPQVTRLTKGFAALGVAAVVAAGGFAATHVVGGSASATQALSSASAPASASDRSVSATASSPVTPVASGSINATPVSAPTNLGAGQPVIGGGKPSITGAGAGEEDDD